MLGSNRDLPPDNGATTLTPLVWGQSGIGDVAAHASRWWQQARGEIQGGIAGAVSSLPQSIAYGIIAFAPLGPGHAGDGALAGIYSSIVGGLVACLTGASAVMVSGSRAATAVVFAALLTQLASSAATPPDSLLAAAFLTVLLAGLIQFLFGLVKVGHLVKYLPQTVIAGFLNGSGLLILAGQIPTLTGVQLAGLFSAEGPHWAQVQWGALALGLGTALTMVTVPRLCRNAPAGLVALIAGSAVYQLLQYLTGGGLPLGGTLPPVGSVLPTPRWADDIAALVASGGYFDLLPVLIPAALSIAVISSLDSLLSAAALDNLTLNRTDGNRELIAQGAGNVAAALFGGTPSSGSMGRSGGLFRAGGRRRWSVALNVALLLASLALFAPAIGLIPTAVVAGVLLVIGVQLFDKWTVRLLRSDWRNGRWADFRAELLVISSVVAATLIWDLMMAVGLGIVLAAVIFLRRMSRSLIRRRYRGNHVHSRQLRDERLTALLERHGQRIIVLELEGAIFFGSADGLETTIDRLAAEGTDYFVLDMKRVKDIDSSGAFILQRIHRRLSLAGKLLVVSYVDKERRTQDDRRQPQAGNFLAIGHTSQDRRAQADRRQSSASADDDRRLWRLLANFGVTKALGEAAFLADTDMALGVCEARLIQSLADDALRLEDFDARLSDMLGSLTRDELTQVRPLLEPVTFPAGTVIFHQGDPGDALYLLLKGVADVTINISRGRQKRVQTLLPGTIFGEMAMLDGEPRAANVVVVEEAECLRLSREDFEMLKVDHPGISLKLLAKIGVLFARRLRSANLMIMELET